MYYLVCYLVVYFVKQKAAYEVLISDWISDVCSSDLISTFDESQLFNRDRPAVAADQARRGEGGGDHAAFTDSAKSSNETGTPWLSAISLIGTQYLDGI